MESIREDWLQLNETGKLLTWAKNTNQGMSISVHTTNHRITYNVHASTTKVNLILDFKKH